MKRKASEVFTQTPQQQNDLMEDGSVDWNEFFVVEAQDCFREETLKDEPDCDDEGSTESPSSSDAEDGDDPFDDEEEDYWLGGRKKRKGKVKKAFTSKHIRQHMSSRMK